MATEKLKFKLELYATMWDKPPVAEISINNKVYFTWFIDGTKDEPTMVEFEHKFEEGEDYYLTIKRSGKDNKQTVVENGKIIKDQVLEINRIEIDEIDIGALVYEGVYTPEYPEPWATEQREAGTELKKSFKNVTQMGHNGTWRFKFSSPFYMWLLENLY